MTEKKNQHYIPKFYLRNFSYKANEKQIGLFNIFNSFFISQAKLKTQGSKNFYYGKDGQVEDYLSILEGRFAKIVRDIISSQQLPRKLSNDHFELLSFLVFTDLRNPVRIESMKGMFFEMKKRLVELDENVNVEKFVPKISHEESIEMSFSMIPELILNIADLEYKLLINETKTPFISSDFPVVKYNQYLELKKWPHSKTGFATVGLQIFIPLNHKLVIVFFDSSIYKVGNRKQLCVPVNQTNSVNEINKLQYVNCFETIYFDEKISEDYIRNLHQVSKKYKRANQSKSELSYIVHEGEDSKEIISGKQNLMIFNSSDCETNLKVDVIKIHSNGQAHKLNSTMAQSRKFPESVQKIKNNH